MRFQLDALARGAMVTVPATKAALPSFLPDVMMGGRAWILESTPASIRLVERLEIGRFLTMDARSTMRMGANDTLQYTLEGRLNGIIPIRVSRTFDVLESAPGRLEFIGADATAGRGLLGRLLHRGADDAAEAPSYIRISQDGRDMRFGISLRRGMHTERVETITQPGSPGWEPAPTDLVERWG